MSQGISSKTTPHDVPATQNAMRALRKPWSHHSLLQCVSADSGDSISRICLNLAHDNDYREMWDRDNKNKTEVKP